MGLLSGSPIIILEKNLLCEAQILLIKVDGGNKRPCMNIITIIKSSFWKVQRFH